jgi:tetratricopeptide (TPR) repeat protein
VESWRPVLLLLVCLLALPALAAPNAPPSQGGEAKSYGAMAEGEQLFKQGHWEEAIHALGRAVKENARNEHAWYLLGLAEMQLYHWDEAEKAFLAVVGLNTRSYNAWVKLGEVELSRGNYDKARDYVRRVLVFDSRSFYAYYALGVIDYKQGRLDLALHDFDRSRALFDEFAATSFNLGVCYYNQHNLTNAMSAIGKAVRLEPSRPLYLFLQGWYAFMSNDPGTGFLAFRHLFQEDKKNSEYSDTARAFLAMRSNDLVAARKSLDEALKKNPEMVKALVLNALILIKDNKKDEAVKALQEALDVDSLDYDARDVLNHLGVAPPPPHPARLPGPRSEASPSPGPGGSPSPGPGPSASPGPGRSASPGAASPSPSPTAKPSPAVPPPPGVPRR